MLKVLQTLAWVGGGGGGRQGMASRPVGGVGGGGPGVRFKWWSAPNLQIGITWRTISFSTSNCRCLFKQWVFKERLNSTILRVNLMFSSDRFTQALGKEYKGKDSRDIALAILFLNIHCKALKQHCNKIVENNAYCPTFLIVSSYSRRALLVAIKNDSCWGLRVFCQTHVGLSKLHWLSGEPSLQHL